MPAPGTLFGEATQALEGASQTADSANQLKEKSREASMASGDEASRNLNAQTLERLHAQLDQQANLVEVTPQIALGLVRNTGDKEWMKMAGPGPDGKPQKMRADMLLGMYTHGMDLAQAKKAPKITQIYDDNGKIRHAVVYTDEQGNVQQLTLDAGMTPAKLNEGKGGKGKSASDDTLKKNKEFMRSHEKQAALFNDASKSEQLKAANPEQWSRENEEYLKDQDRYDQLKTEMGKAGGSSAASGGGSAPAGDSPFDADAFIKDALGDGGSRGGL